MGTHEYFMAYNAVADKHGIGEREMLVLLKAYAQYKADEGQEKPENECGWMNAEYDIVPSFNRFGEGRIYIPDSFYGAKDFWETDASQKHWRLSPGGLKFVADNQGLYDASTVVLHACCVTRGD